MEPKKKKKLGVRALKNRLQGYLDRHPETKLDLSTVNEFDRWLLRSPWGDPSIAFVVFDSNEGIHKSAVDALNNVFLHPRLSAIVHTDTNDIEIIWTAYKLSENQRDIIGRKFDINIDGTTVSCEFGKSSSRLLALAKQTIFLKASETAFRNLQSFASYARYPDRKDAFGDPLSFYIKGLSLEDPEFCFEIIRNLNFHLTYFDSLSPFIIIHPDDDEYNSKPKTRFENGSFPVAIKCRKLDQVLLAFWLAARNQEFTTKFLLYYRILEYVSTSYLKMEQRQKIHKILADPAASGSIERTIDRAAGVLRESSHESQRFGQMFNELVDEEKVWREICLNPDAFTSDLQLDGGFFEKAVVADTKDSASFGPRGMENVARVLRSIRHGLAHGGEAQAEKIILPTERNFKKLLPWLCVMEVAAGEVILYEHLS